MNVQRIGATRWLGVCAMAGLGVWAAWGGVLITGHWRHAHVFPVIDWLTLLGPLGALPLGLRLARARPLETIEDAAEARAWRRIAIGAPVAMLLALLSMTLGKGIPAAVLGAGYTVLTWLVARRATARLWAREPRGLAERAVDVASVYLFVGGVMWAVARSGYRPFGLGEPIVTLAATHFHFAGFVLLVVTGEAGRYLGASRGAVRGPIRALYVVGTWLAMVAPAFVAFGIIESPGVEVVASVALASGGLAVAIVVLAAVAPRLRPLLAGSLVSMAALALTIGMIAAGTFAIGNFVGDRWLSIPIMVPLHGVANGVLFGLGALVGLGMARGAPATEPSERS